MLFYQVYVAHGRLELAMPIEKVKETSKLSLMVCFVSLSQSIIYVSLNLSYSNYARYSTNNLEYKLYYTTYGCGVNSLNCRPGCAIYVPNWFCICREQ